MDVKHHPWTYLWKHTWRFGMRRVSYCEFGNSDERNDHVQTKKKGLCSLVHLLHSVVPFFWGQCLHGCWHALIGDPNNKKRNDMTRTCVATSRENVYAIISIHTLWNKRSETNHQHHIVIHVVIALHLEIVNDMNTHNEHGCFFVHVWRQTVRDWGSHPHQ